MSTSNYTLLLFLLSALGLGCNRSTPVASRLIQRATPDANNLTADEQVSVNYYFDRNALVNSIRIHDALLVQTRSGNLLRIELETMQIEAERFYREPVVTLAAGMEDRAYVALEDGTIMEVDEVSLNGRPLALVPGIPQWLAYSSKRNGLVAIVRKPAEGLVVYEVKSGRSIALPHDFMQDSGDGHFMLDSNGRLWIGIDEGEWGGRIAVLDLDTGITRQVPHAAHEGVYGFAELPGRTILAHGGVSHLSMLKTFISVVNLNSERTLYSADSRSSDANRQRREKQQPLAPISHLAVETPKSLLLLSGNSLYRSDLALAHFQKIASLPTRAFPGRPDALGDYPAVSVVHSLGAGAFVCTTARDGILRGDAAAISSHGIRGQIDLSSIYWILPSSTGVVLIDGTGAPTAMRRSTSLWEHIPRLGSQQDLDEPEFTTPDRSHWRVSNHLLQRLQNGEWRSESKAPHTGRVLEVVNGPEPPWVLVDRLYNQLLLISTETASRAPELRRIEITEKVTDAIRYDSKHLLVATLAGLKLLNPRTAEIQEQGGSQGTVYSLGRDNLGRVWLGGKGLWISKSQTELLPLRAVHSPAMPNREIVALAADPYHPDGILAAMGRYGLMAVQVPVTDPSQ